MWLQIYHKAHPFNLQQHTWREQLKFIPFENSGLYAGQILRFVPLNLSFRVQPLPNPLAFQALLRGREVLLSGCAHGELGQEQGKGLDPGKNFGTWKHAKVSKSRIIILKTLAD